MTRAPRRRTRTRPLPDHAPTAAEADRDLAVDRGEATSWEDDVRAGLAGWGEK